MSLAEAEAAAATTTAPWTYFLEPSRCLSVVFSFLSLLHRLFVCCEPASHILTSVFPLFE
jgi:hypothetical protein